uniref:CUE domain-containing protein n=1 Tax=Serinus canaria TaxID=9135 RepID=A0A8C9UGY4_SERCA
MSLYNLDRFRFERKGKGEEQVSPSPPAACAETPGAAAAVRAAGGDEEEGTDDNKRPGTPASDVTERTEYSTIPETPEAQRTRKESYFKRQRGVQFLDVSDSEDEEPRKVPAAKETQVPRAEVALISGPSDDDDQPEEEMPQQALVNGGDQQPAVKDRVAKDTRDSKLQTMKERFPQRSDQELLKLIESACTMDEAVAAGLKLNDKAASGKRKQRDSPTNCKTKNEQVAKKSKVSYVSTALFSLCIVK